MVMVVMERYLFDEAPVASVRVDVGQPLLGDEHHAVLAVLEVLLLHRLLRDEQHVEPLDLRK
jgi:hypothetical protein